MKKRQKIKALINSKEESIKKIKLEISELEKESILLCDKEQWFTEENETHEISSKPKIEKLFLVGRINWNEEFKDEAGGKSIWIKRSCVVRVDGEWRLSE